MEGAAVKEIERLAREAAGQTVIIEEIEYSTTPLHDVRKKDPVVEPLEVSTLSGFVGYIRANRDVIDLSTTIVHVESQQIVSLVGKLFGHFQQRHNYVRAIAPNRMEATPFRFGAWGAREQMHIALQSLFEDAADRAKVLRLLGTVTAEAAETQADDGITQKVTARSGISVLEPAIVPNPVKLAPFRTFAEISQPVSPFVFRLRRRDNDNEAALFEADGGAWKEQAVASIKEYLRKELPPVVTIIG